VQFLDALTRGEEKDWQHLSSKHRAFLLLIWRAASAESIAKV